MFAGGLPLGCGRRCDAGRCSVLDARRPSGLSLFLRGRDSAGTHDAVLRGVLEENTKGSNTLGPCPPPPPFPCCSPLPRGLINSAIIRLRLPHFRALPGGQHRSVAGAPPPTSPVLRSSGPRWCDGSWRRTPHDASVAAFPDVASTRRLSASQTARRLGWGPTAPWCPTAPGAAGSAFRDTWWTVSHVSVIRSIGGLGSLGRLGQRARGVSCGAHHR